VDAFVGDQLETSLTGLLQGYRENTIKLQKVKGPTLYEKATENSTQMWQALALVGALFFQWFRKNKEQGAVLRQETPTAGAHPSEGSSALESRGIAGSSADPDKKD